MTGDNRRARWTDQEHSHLKSMINAGRTIPEIAREMGRSQEAVRGRAKEFGWFAYPSRLFTGKAPPGAY